MLHTFGEGSALLIGVGRCLNFESWSLPVTVKDAQALAAILTDPNLCAYPENEQHLRLLHDESAGRQGILDGLDWLKLATQGAGNATAVIYFSGHGWLDEKDGQYYLIPSDVKPFNISSSALPAQEFILRLQQIRARRILIIIDSCHAEGMATSKNILEPELPPAYKSVPFPQQLVEILKEGEGRAVFTSSRGFEKSWIHQEAGLSIYTYHLLEALRGAGNVVGDTAVHLSNLMDYLSHTVPSTAMVQWEATQTPFFDLSAENFPIALLYGGKGMTERLQAKVRSETLQFIQRVTAVGFSEVEDVSQTHDGGGGAQIIEAKGNSVIRGVVQQSRKINNQ